MVSPFFRESAGLIGSEAHSRNVLQISKFGTPAATIHTQTIHARPTCSQRHGGKLTTN